MGIHQGASGAGLTDHGFRGNQAVGLPGAVEVGDALSGKLEMLPLVVAHRNVGSTVDQDISGLENRIGEEAVLESSLSP